MADPAPGQKYGWTCDSLDDERMEAPFDSPEAALADAKATIEEEAPNREWDSGTHAVEVGVCRVSPYRPFNAERVLDDVIDHMGDDGFNEPDEQLQLCGAARATLAAALRVAWEEHVTRESLGEFWEATHREATHTVMVTIPEPRPA